MTPAFIAITILKQSYMPEKQLSNFLLYLSQEALREHLFNADIYKGRNRISKDDFVEMTITGKPKTIKYFDREDELTKEDAIELLKK